MKICLQAGLNKVSDKGSQVEKSNKKEEGKDKSEEEKERPNTKTLEMTRVLVLAGFLVCKAFNPPAYNPLLLKNLKT